MGRGLFDTVGFLKASGELQLVDRRFGSKWRRALHRQSRRGRPRILALGNGDEMARAALKFRAVIAILLRS